MKRLTEAQSDLIDAFVAERPSRVSTAQLEKDILISELFPVFARPVAYRDHEAAFVLCGGTAVSKAHRYTQRISEDIDLRVVVPAGLSRSGTITGSAMSTRRAVTCSHAGLICSSAAPETSTLSTSGIRLSGQTSKILSLSWRTARPGYDPGGFAAALRSRAVWRVVSETHP